MSPHKGCAATLAAVLLVSGPAGARKRDAVPASGLRSVRLLAPAPDFAFDAGSGEARLSQLAGRVVVVNFWATWCEPCRAELDAFVRLRGAYGSSVELVTVSDEAPGVARAFLAQRRLALPVAEDPERKIFAAYSIHPIPVTLVIAADRTVRHVSVGELDWAELSGAIDAVRGPSAPAASASPGQALPQRELP